MSLSSNDPRSCVFAAGHDRRADEGAERLVPSRVTTIAPGRGKYSWGWVLALLVSLGACGCKTLEMPSIKNIYGRKGKAAQDAVDGPYKLGELEGQADYEKAKALYDSKQYAAAEKSFKKMLKKYKDKPIEEDVMFMRAECYYHEGLYPKAEDCYAELLKKHTATRHIETATRRLFTLARNWLQSPRPASDIELAQYNDGELEKRARQHQTEKEGRNGVIPNFWDKSRPMFDTDGRALHALNAIWLHDPNGPLSDDALMMQATYQLRHENYFEADRLFRLIREQYPKSEHIRAAYVLGMHAKRMSYQGAGYDGKDLQEARNLAMSTIRLFPDIEQKDQIVSDLKKMRQQAAERDWKMAQLFMQKRRPKSAAIYYELILQDHPHSPYAAQAHAALDKLGPQYANVFKKETYQQERETIKLAGEERPAKKRRPVKEVPPEGSEPEERPVADNRSPKVRPGKVPNSDDAPPEDQQPEDQAGRVTISDGNKKKSRFRFW